MPRTINLETIERTRPILCGGSVSKQEAQARSKGLRVRATARGCAVAKKALSSKPPIRPEKLTGNTHTNEHGNNGIMLCDSRKRRTNKAQAESMLRDMLLASGL